MRRRKFRLTRERDRCSAHVTRERFKLDVYVYANFSSSLAGLSHISQDESRFDERVGLKETGREKEERREAGRSGEKGVRHFWSRVNGQRTTRKVTDGRTRVNEHERRLRRPCAESSATLRARGARRLYFPYGPREFYPEEKTRIRKSPSQLSPVVTGPFDDFRL